MSQVPAKIVLKSTTKMSLNDRFTNIQKTRPQTTAPAIRANMMAQQQASAKNRRLAQQLANRPGLGGVSPQQMGGGPGAGVAAAMRLKKVGDPRSLQQRLGRSNVKARLNLSAVGRGQNRGAPRGNRRGMRGQRRGQRGGPMNRQQSNGSAGGDAMGAFSGNFQQGRGGRGVRRGGFRGNTRGFQGGFRGRGRGGQSPGGRGRFQRGGRFRGRGGRGQGRGGRGGPQSQMSREELDNQLEEYMSKTKSHLDNELDAYMADAS